MTNVATGQPRLGAIVVSLVILGTQLAESSEATDLTQLFPAVPPGQAAPEAESGWRLSWDVLPPGAHGYGPESDVLEFTSIEFMRGKVGEEEDWVPVLDSLTMIEMYVLYNDLMDFLDVSNVGAKALHVNPSYLPQSGVVSARIEDEFVVSEVSDDGLRWLDNEDSYSVRRGQVLKLWAAFQVYNYTYIVTYSFSDDGQIGVRVGGTAQNFYDWDGSQGDLDQASHVHMGAWRMEFDLGDPERNRIQIVERVVGPNNRPRLAYRAFNGGREGCEVWNPDTYSVLSVTNQSTVNRHDPPRNISYVLKTVELGRLRHPARPVTECDFWVSRLVPASGARRVLVPERYHDLPLNLQSPEPIDGEPVVVWHNSGVFHIPRGEDFGPVGYLSTAGAAIPSYAGFDLVPVNLWHKTPFLDR